MSTDHAATDNLQKRSKLNFLSVLCLCATSAFLTASVVLIFQYKRGLPFSFVISMILAVTIALLIPAAITFLFTRFKKHQLYTGYVVFMLSNLLIATAIGIQIF